MEHTSKFIKDLADQTGVRIGKIQSMWKDAEREANKRIMWEPTKYAKYSKSAAEKSPLIADILREMLGADESSP